MRIVICSKAIQERDGTCQFAIQLGEMLVNAGHEVTMIAAVIHSWELVKNTPQLSYISIHQKSFENKVMHVKRIGEIFQRMNFQVVFICSGLPVPNLEYALGLVADHTVIVPIVGGDRDYIYQQMINTANFWNMAVAESPRLEEQINFRMPQKHTKMLVTGITQPLDSELANRIGHSSPLRIIFVGRLFGRKNALMLPKILAACVKKGIKVELTICGKGEDQEQLIQSCNEKGISHLLNFAEYPLRSDLYDAYRSHHVLLWTSDYGEGLGLVLMEAQANGCVPVASRLLGVTDFTLEDEKTGLLAEIGNEDEFANKIGRLADQETWQRFSAAAIERTKNKFSFNEMQREYSELLDELLAGNYPLSNPRSTNARPVFKLMDYLPQFIFSISNKIKRKLATFTLSKI